MFVCLKSAQKKMSDLITMLTERKEQHVFFLINGKESCF